MHGVGLLKVSIRHLDSMTVGRTDHTCVTFKKRSLGDDLEWITDWDYRYTYIDFLTVCILLRTCVLKHKHTSTSRSIISYNNSFTCMVHGSPTPPENHDPPFDPEEGGCSLVDLSRSESRHPAFWWKTRLLREKNWVACFSFSFGKKATLLYIDPESIRLGCCWKHGVPSGVAVRFRVEKTGEDGKTYENIWQLCLASKVRRIRFRFTQKLFFFCFGNVFQYLFRF